MKPTRILLLSALGALCFNSVSAEQIKLANRQADELLGSLLSIVDGLTAVNTTIVADNILELQPKVESYAKGNAAAQKKFNISTKTLSDDVDAVKYVAEIEANRDHEITVDLTRLDLSNDEITALKLKPDVSKPTVLAVLRKYLKPVLPAKAK